MIEFITCDANDAEMNLALVRRAFGISRGKLTIDEGRIPYWVSRGHTSPLEFANYVFEVADFDFEEFVANAHMLGGYMFSAYLGRTVFSCNARTIRDMVNMDMSLGYHLLPVAKQMNPVFFEDLDRVIGSEAQLYKGLDFAFEDHRVWVFEAVISRACSHQLVRHRKASYMQESQRWVDYTENPNFIWPRPSDPEEFAIMDHALDFLHGAYGRLMRLGVAKEDARYVLPNAMPTRVLFAMSGFGMRNFIAQRTTQHAQAEIREMAEYMRDVYENGR